VFNEPDHNPMGEFKEVYNKYKEEAKPLEKQLEELETQFHELFQTVKALKATLAATDPTDKARAGMAVELKEAEDRMYQTRDQIHSLSSKIEKLKNEDSFANEVLNMQEIDRMLDPEFRDN